MGKLNEIQQQSTQSYGGNSFTTKIEENTVVFDSAKDSFTFNDPVDAPALTINGQEVVPGEQVQADWNQNDSTKADFIKNRIAYKEEVEPQTVAIIDTEIISTSGTYVLKGSSVINNSWYYGIILPKGVKKEYGVEKTIEISNGTETYEIKYTLQPKYGGSLVCPDGFQGGGGWYDKGYTGIPEALRNYDFAISLSCSNIYEGFTVKQYETTSSENVNKIDTIYNSEGIGGIKEVEPEVLIDADLSGSFDWPENKKLNEGDVCLISYPAPWASAPNDYQITGKGVAYSEGGVVKVCLEGYSVGPNSSFIGYNIYPNPSNTGYLSSWPGRYKVVKIGEAIKIDDNLVNIPAQVQADWTETNSFSPAYIDHKPTIGNGTITLKSGNTTVGSFTLNQTGSKTLTLPEAPAQIQADWNQNDSTAADYIKNKPTIQNNSNIVNGSRTGSLRTTGSAQESSSYTIGDYAFTEGYGTKASGALSHAEGNGTTASGALSHAEGNGTTASGDYSHAEGDGSTASGSISHAEGDDTTASGTNSHAEGGGTKASGVCAHAEGRRSQASGECAHAEGGGTTASGDYSHAEGDGSTASGTNSHAEGNFTIANHKSQHVFGEYNIIDSSPAGASERGNYVEIVGNGANSSAKSNARTLDWNGNEVLSGTLQIGGTSGAILKTDGGVLKVSLDNGTTWLTIQTA